MSRVPVHIVRLICAMALLMLSAGSWATSRMGQIEVRDQSGIPCFAIPKDEEQRAGAVKLSALDVYDITDKPGNAVWSLGLAANVQPKPIPFATCIRYGQAPEGTSIVKAESPLAIGKIYRVEFGALPSDRSDPTFGYDARFCLVAQSNGAVKVHQIEFRDGWRYEVCR